MVGFTAALLTCLAVAADENYFYDDDKPKGMSSLFQNLMDFKGHASEWSLYDTFEGYWWHRYLHLPDHFRKFYLQEQAQKEFGQLRNISFDVDVILIEGERVGKVKPKYEHTWLYPGQREIGTYAGDGQDGTDIAEEPHFSN